MPDLNLSTSDQLFTRAKDLMPGGVNSPVRAFRAVGGHPVFMKSAQGAWLTDVDGNRYLDFINSWGPMILGHAPQVVLDAVQHALPDSLSFGAPTRREVEMAELICEMVPSVEKVRLVNSGTEATMSAIRVARGYTGRAKILKFEGCYHGHGDSFLISAGSGALTLGTPDSPGVTQGVAQDTLTAPYNDLAATRQILEANPGQIAAMIIEPVVGNIGLVPPAEGFLQGLRELCTQHGIVFIFDEVMTGFRLARGGAQELFGVLPDLTTLGKIIGGGMPVGAYGGRRDIMDQVAPAGKVYQAGTLSGNPIATAAGLAQLRYLQEHPELYQELDRISARLADGTRQIAAELGLNYTVNRVGSMWNVFFTAQPVTDLASAKTSDLEAFGRYFRAMLHRGMYLAPSQYEAVFISTAMTDDLVDLYLTACRESMREAHGL
ncbi:glutamate-1-semialdehyde-2,1-aminomutase [Hymenobacter busanensis]|uniref:Glutamate-1-semialdehyde 2,1-aminomutase n=1 Tax=Hymenobacter busanensis TaxID=2607656 RepID=A0A7L4ZUG0_9BACT|nr:glutamate-1-semialdehyde 2,1-aminomutase [Hymenobacter busanensis]KAA9339434.1 glutamate-1-semialdehyde-2,1-aminomutase [Hymenobacter busanensis]QHJ06808.1 glutamate-1-semialdehyde 2,1-aminomutase [Hymenobacter busanensis]